MTVGIAALADSDTPVPKAIVAADRLMTTQQQSAIEHEHPEAKLVEIAPQENSVYVLGVVAGSVSLGEELTNQIDSAIRQWRSKNQQATLTAEMVSEVARNQYQILVQNKIQDNVLSQYGLDLDDLSKQHQFKDEFFRNLMAEVNNVQDVIFDHLTLLIGGVDSSGCYIYEISHNDVTRHNRVGYNTIGSGSQPAQSEFIHSMYSSTEPVEVGLATVSAANHRANRAAGVGGEMDIGVVWWDSQNNIGNVEIATDSISERLMTRQADIERIQERARDNILDHNSVNWRPGP